MNVFSARKYIEERLDLVAGDCAVIEAEQVLMKALNCSRNFLYAYPESEIDKNALTHINAIVSRRAKGEPLQYIFGTAPFMGLDFAVRPGVLIPRRDTEVLVEAALPYCKGKRVLDLCTGSGCIGISVACLGKPSSIALSDYSEVALEIAKENARAHAVSPLFYQGDFLRAIPDGVTFDVILSNPPYISLAEMQQLPLDVKNYEPELALCAGEDGLDAYKSILQDVSRVLIPGGYLFLEIGYTQGNAVSHLMKMHGFTQIQVLQDYGKQDRVVIGCLGTKGV